MLMMAKREADSSPTLTRVVRNDARATGLRAAVEPLHLLAAGIAGLLLVWTVKSLSENDLFWHVPLGNQILDTHHVAGAGTGWTTAAGTGGWISSEWLAEVGMAAVHNSFGWNGILWLRLVLATILMVAVLYMVLRTSTARVAAVSMIALAAPIAFAVEERPQLVSFILLVPTAIWAHRVLTGGKGPNLWIAAPMVLVWAQIHSLWLLLPGMLILASLCRMLDVGRAGIRTLRSPLVAGIALLAVGCITPLGPRALVLPLELHGATARIAEWQPTTPQNPMCWGLMLVLGLMAFAWARHGRGRVPSSEMAFTCVLALFSLMAFRNVLPAMLLLTPLTTTRLSQTHWGRPGTVGVKESKILRGTGLLALAVALLFAAAKTASVPTFGSKVPVLIAQTLADEPGEHRVLNSYNVSGVLVAFGGPNVKLSIDGRADRWGSDYINDYLDLIAMKGDWRTNIAKLNVTDAVLPDDAPIVGELVRDGWTRQLSDCSYVLLKAPAVYTTKVVGS